MADWLLLLVIFAALAGFGGWLLLRSRRGPSMVPEPGVAPAVSVANDAAVPGAATSPPALAYLQFEDAVSPVPVTKDEVVIGRHSSDDIRVNDVRVSRHHARLVALRDGRFEIHNKTAARSEGAANVMAINGVEREHGEVRDGDVVTLGGLRFAFRAAPAAS